MSVSPDDTHGRRHLGIDQHGAFHRYARRCKVVANVLVDTRPRVALYTADGKEVWVTAEVGGTAAVIDAATRKAKHRITFQIPGVRPELIQPMGVQFATRRHARGRRARPRQPLAVIDTSTYEVLKYVLVGQRPWHIALSADGSQLYSANGLSNDLTIVDTKTWNPEKSIPVGRLPWGIVLAMTDRATDAGILISAAAGGASAHCATGCCCSSRWFSPQAWQSAQLWPTGGPRPRCRRNCTRPHRRRADRHRRRKGARSRPEPLSAHSFRDRALQRRPPPARGTA